MSGPVKSLLLGLTDPGQAAEAGRLGIDGAVIQIEGEGPLALAAEDAAAVADALPPLAARLAWTPNPGSIPPGFTGIIQSRTTAAVRSTLRRVFRLEHDEADPAEVPEGVAALWVRPRPEGSSAVVRFDFQILEHLACRHPLILEIPDGASGIEAVVRIARPYAVLLGEAVWFRPGIIDLDRLEKALMVIARLNKPPL